MVSTLGLVLGLVLTVLAVLVHVSKGTGWQPREDISDEVMNHRAESVPETEFPEPMNRSIGGGSGTDPSSTGEAVELTEGESDESVDGPWTLSDGEANSFEVEFKKEGATIEVRENENLLEAGEAQGWDLPYACREGRCLSCSARTPDGDARDFVIHNNQEMLNDEELSQGYMLTCVAYPQAGHSLETRESP